MAEHYYSPKPTSAVKPKVLQIRLGGMQYSLHTASGVFSKEGLDQGTAVLLEFMQLPDEGMVLDLGCGIGIVGIVVKRRKPKLQVCMSDVNGRAVRLAQRNAKENKVAAEVRYGDGFAPWEGVEFSAVLLNPPQHAGKEVCFRLIQEAYGHLMPNGTLQLVIRRNKGGASFSEEMERVFGNVEEVGKRSGFGVYGSRR